MWLNWHTKKRWSWKVLMMALRKNMPIPTSNFHGTYKKDLSLKSHSLWVLPLSFAESSLRYTASVLNAIHGGWWTGLPIVDDFIIPLPKSNQRLWLDCEATQQHDHDQHPTPSNTKLDIAQISSKHSKVWEFKNAFGYISSTVLGVLINHPVTIREAFLFRTGIPIKLSLATGILGG